MIPTTNVVMSDVRRILALAGLASSTGPLSIGDDSIRLMAGNLTGPVKLGNCRGSTLLRLNNVATIQISPEQTIVGWDNQGGPLQAAGATAVGDFSLENAVSPRQIAWLRTNDGGTFIYEILIELDGPCPGNLSITALLYSGGYAVNRDMSSQAGRRVLSVPVSADEWNNMTSLSSITFCFKNNLYKN